MFTKMHHATLYMLMKKNYIPYTIIENIQKRLQPTLLKQGVVSISFDDQLQTTYDNALLILEKYDMLSTWFICTDHINGTDPNSKLPCISWKAIIHLSQIGHEIGSHSKSHPHFSNHSPNRVIKELKDYAIIPICPEQLGGLTTPRPPAQIFEGTGDDVLINNSKVLRIEDKIDVTEQYVKGAEASLYLAKLFGAKEAYLKEKSPACGVHFIKRDEDNISGSGVCAALLRAEGMTLHSVD